MRDLAAEHVGLADLALVVARARCPSATSSTWTRLKPELREHQHLQLPGPHLVDDVAELGVVAGAVDAAGLHDHDRRALRRCGRARPRARGTSSRRRRRGSRSRRAGSSRRRPCRRCCRRRRPWRRRRCARHRPRSRRRGRARCRARWRRPLRALRCRDRRPCRPRAAWKTASQPVEPRRIAPRDERSPSTSSQPSAARSVAFSGERTSATTSSPRSRSLRTTRPPMKPVPPVMKILIRSSSSRAGGSSLRRGY